MTTVEFHTEPGGRITGFDSQGHSGYAEAGEDIVCAAITSAIRLAECAVNDVLGLGAPVHTDEKNAVLSLRLPGGELSSEAETVSQTILAALMVYLAELHEEYPDYIDVLEV